MTFPHRKPRGSRGKRGPASPDDIPLGYRTNAETIGFNHRREEKTPSPEIIRHQGDEHALLFAPTGQGKGVSIVMPALLSYPGPAIVMDVKGDAVHVTAEHRRRMGQKVYVIDPFHVTTDQPDTLNPLDLNQLGGAADVDGESLASVLGTGKKGDDTYWLDSATPLVAATITHVLTAEPPKRRCFEAFRTLLRHEDFDLILAQLVAGDKVPSRYAREQFSSYLGICAERTRPCVLSTARTFLSSLDSDAVTASLDHTSFSWEELIEGKPMTIYFVIPPHKLSSHQALVRLWIGTLMLAFSTRSKLPEKRTLLLLDEVAQLGEMPVLRDYFTLLRGYGVQIFAFYQDISQLRQTFPNDWETILNNAGVLGVFGLSNYKMACDWSQLLGMHADDLFRMKSEEMVLCTPGRRSEIVRRLNYLTDDLFRGMFSPNPRFSK